MRRTVLANNAPPPIPLTTLRLASMMRTMIRFTLFFVLCAVWTAGARAQDTPAPSTPPAAALEVERKLSAIDREKGTEAALTEIGRLVSGEKVGQDNLMGSTRFLSERDAHGNDPRYGLSLSVMEAKLANTFAAMPDRMKEAVTFRFQSVTRYLGNSLVLRQDIARCADKTAGARAIAGWQGLTRDMIAAYKEFPPEIQAKVREGIEIYQTKKADRPTLPWVCRDGIDVIRTAQEKGFTTQTETEVNGVKSTDTRATEAVDPLIRFVDDATWAGYRKQVYDTMLSTLDK